MQHACAGDGHLHVLNCGIKTRLELQLLNACMKIIAKLHKTIIGPPVVDTAGPRPMGG